MQIYFRADFPSSFVRLYEKGFHVENENCYQASVPLFPISQAIIEISI